MNYTMNYKKCTLSDQVRVLNMHIESKSVADTDLFWPSPVPLSGTGKKGGGNGRGRGACTDGYKRVQAVRPGSVAGGGC